MQSAKTIHENCLIEREIGVRKRYKMRPKKKNPVNKGSQNRVANGGNKLTKFTARRSLRQSVKHSPFQYSSLAKDMDQRKQIEPGKVHNLTPLQNLP